MGNRPPPSRPYPCRVLALLSPRYWGAHLLMVLALAAAIALGIWQLHAWQAGRDAAATDLTTAAPKPLSSVMGGDEAFPGKALGQPVRFSGKWMPQSTLYVQDRDLGGKRGYWVVTPVLVGRSAMPVVRGWASRPEAPAATGPAQVTGWLQPSEGSGATDSNPNDDVIPEMRVASIVQHVDADLYSAFVVQKELSTSDVGLRQVTPESIPEVSSTDHLRNLLYAFQWWIFGGFAVYVWQRWCRDQLEVADEEAVRERQPAAS
jgi:surfeit locus 1 family protein